MYHHHQIFVENSDLNLFLYSELSSIAEDILETEKQFNHNLEEHSILVTNPLDLAIAKWINYKP